LIPARLQLLFSVIPLTLVEVGTSKFLLFMKNQACGLVLLFLCACSTSCLLKQAGKEPPAPIGALPVTGRQAYPRDCFRDHRRASFTGANQPVISSSAFCSSLTIGGTVASTLTISKTLSVSGSLTIQSNGTIIHNKTTVSLKGNWTNNGTYTGNFAQTNVNFIGSAQSINGTSVTSFRKATINSSSAVTLGQNIAVANTLTVNGTLNPNESPTYQVTGGLSLSSTGTLLVKAATFAGNYTGSVTASAGSIVDYSATTVAQIVSNTITYSTLRISGSGTKTLAGNLPALNATTAATGNIYITAGTLDASSFTADRGTAVAGGTLSISNGAFLKLGGTTTFPSNFATTALSLTSTVEYNGTAQTIAAQTYGNLILSGSGGVAVKTLPATDSPLPATLQWLQATAQV
jgi:hypothetical protein